LIAILPARLSQIGGAGSAEIAEEPSAARGSFSAMRRSTQWRVMLAAIYAFRIRGEALLDAAIGVPPGNNAVRGK